MSKSKYLLILALSSAILAFNQVPFVAPELDGSERYNFEHPIRKVAVIGAGVGGLITYREFRDVGLDVHLYERDDSPGGNWHYTDEAPIDAPIPNLDPVVGDFTPSFPPKDVKLPYTIEYQDTARNNIRRREHRAPRPLWKSLSSNAPGPIQQIREFPWPEGSPWTLPNRLIQRYLRAFASWHKINNNDENPTVFYNTRVENVEKRRNDEGREDGWTLTLRELVRTPHGSLKVTWSKKDYDAVAVASGRYNAPFVASIPGIAEWNARFPGRIVHSRQYRVPEPYSNETILIIGASVSGGEISRELSQHAAKIYQSIRPDRSPSPRFPQSIFLSRIPKNVTIIPEIKRFLRPTSNISEGRIELVNGTVISGFDRIISATGYRYSYPFLPEYHNSTLRLDEQANPDAIQPIVTDGTHLRSLYLDVFYIPDPSLAFINAGFAMQSFTQAEFQSAIIAKVWSGLAVLPPINELWKWYRQEYIDRKGYGRHYQRLDNGRAKALLRYVIAWINSSAVKFGGKQINDLPTNTDEIGKVWFRARFGAEDGAQPANATSGTNSAETKVSCLPKNVLDSWDNSYNAYNDEW